MRRAILLTLLFTLYAQQDPLHEGEQLAAGRKFAAAATAFQKALDQATAQGDLTAMARALLGLGRARFNLEELTAAREALEKSATLAGDAGDTTGAAEALRVLANVC